MEGSSCRGSCRVAAVAVSPGSLQMARVGGHNKPCWSWTRGCLLWSASLNLLPSPATFLLRYIFHQRNSKNITNSVTATKINCHFKALHAEREGLFFEVSVLCCHASVTKLRLDKTRSHPALALAQAAPSWPLAHGDSPAAAGA